MNLPYGRHSVDPSDLEAVARVLRSDWLTQGPTVETFERRIAAYCGARHAVAVSSGTAALHLAALAAGFGDRDQVVTTSNSFVATANCIRYAGAEPRFADIDPQTLNLDPESVEQLLRCSDPTERYRGMIAVHFAGCPAPMERLSRIAHEHDLLLIEDASHAIGASWQDQAGDRQRVGNCSHSAMTTFSFHPVKHLTTGEGGAILTNRSDLAERLRRLRHHGVQRDPQAMTRCDGPWYYEMQELGFNYRITDIQSALGLAQIERLDEWIERRSDLVAHYRRLLHGCEEVRFVTEPEWAKPAWHLFTVQVPRRAELFHTLRARGIGVQVHYIPIHHHPYYRKRSPDYTGALPHCEAYYERALSLPLFPAMEIRDVERVVNELLTALDRTARCAV